MRLPLILFITATLAAAEPVVEPGFTPLFDGKSLAGWWGCSTEDPLKWHALSAEALARKRADSLADIAAHWRAVDGELVNDGNGLYLTSEREFGDIELRLEYRTEARADSGVYLKGCPQVQIWDWTDPVKFERGGDQGACTLNACVATWIGMKLKRKLSWDPLAERFVGDDAANALCARKPRSADYDIAAIMKRAGI